MLALQPALAFGGTLPAMESDAEILRRLRAGDEEAFVTLVESYNGSMLRLAASFVPNRAVAEEVVQDTWLAVLRGLARFRFRRYSYAAMPVTLWPITSAWM